MSYVDLHDLQGPMPAYDEPLGSDRCPTCHGPKHPRLVIRQASHPEPAERPSPVKIAGLSVFLIVLFAVIIYGLPIIGAAAQR